MKLPHCCKSHYFNNRRGLLQVAGLGLVGLMVPSRNVGSVKMVKNGVQLHIYIDTKPGMDKEFESLYHKAYVPAIKVQDGFLRTRLLKINGVNSPGLLSSRYEIDISFDNEKKRANWAESSEHQEAWPKIEAVSSKITWQGFNELS